MTDLARVRFLEDELERKQAENARLREELTVHAIHRYCVSKTKHEAELARLREGLTLIGGYHYSTREAKDLCDIANDALKETT